MNDKLYIIYKKKINAYLLVNSNNKVIWQFNLNQRYKKDDEYLKISKKIDKYIFFLLNMSMFGLCSTNNSYEIYKN